MVPAIELAIVILAVVICLYKALCIFQIPLRGHENSVILVADGWQSQILGPDGQRLPIVGESDIKSGALQLISMSLQTKTT